MTSKPVVTPSTLNARVYQGVRERAGREGPYRPVVSVEYVPVSPAMIGDFTGESYKLLADSNGRFVGAYLTGVPSAQQIIGKARWLMRVALATASGARSHRDAELAGPVTVRRGREQTRLGLVQLAFGSTEPAWHGLLRVRVLPLTEAPKYYAEFNDAMKSVESAIHGARESLADDYFYRMDVTWRVRRRGRTESYAPGRDGGANRYNSLLSQGAKVVEVTVGGSTVKTFIPYSNETGRYRLYDPVRPSRDLLGFRLEILLDTPRFQLVAEGDKARAGAGLALATLSILAVPVLLGLGKAGNRGFGRFKPKPTSTTNTISINIPNNPILVNINRLIHEPASVIEELGRLASRALGLGDSPLRGATWRSTAESLVPRLPLGELSGLAGSYRSDRADSKVERALDVIGEAALKIRWKMICLGITRITRETSEIIAGEKGLLYHTWPLGLPRRGKTRGQTTGYMLRTEEGVSEGRRQSFLVAYSIDGRNIHLIGFPAGDLLEKVLPNLEYYSLLRNRPRPIVKQVSRVTRAKQIIGWGRCDFAELRGPPPDKLKTLLETTFNNFSLSLR